MNTCFWFMYITFPRIKWNIEHWWCVNRGQRPFERVSGRRKGRPHFPRADDILVSGTIDNTFTHVHNVYFCSRACWACAAWLLPFLRIEGKSIGFSLKLIMFLSRQASARKWNIPTHQHTSACRSAGVLHLMEVFSQGSTSAWCNRTILISLLEKSLACVDRP